ncbi:MAG: SLC13 family permease, partial [Loigolactobacillus coryniformis]
MKKRIIGFISGIVVFALIYLLPLNGLSHNGQLYLALTLMTVVWWAMQIA